MARHESTGFRAVSAGFTVFVTIPVYLAVRLWRAVARRPLRKATPDPGDVRSIAIVRLDEMGDFVMLSAVLCPLRAAFPKAHIALVLCDWVCPLAELCPYVDEVIPYPSSGPRWRQLLAGPWRARQVARRYLKGRFDVVLNPRFDRDIRGGAFLAGLSLAPWTFGFPASSEGFKALLNRGYDSFYSHPLPAPKSARHELERNREILRALRIPDGELRPELWLSEEDRREARRTLEEAGWHHGTPLICLGIRASYESKCWPVEYFVELAARIAGETDCSVLIVGSPADRAKAERLRPPLGLRLLNLAGRTSLRVSAAAIGECLLYAGNDSGPKHLAAALGLPVIEITCHPRNGDPAHYQSPVRFGAYCSEGVVLAPERGIDLCDNSCDAEIAHCIREVRVAEVFAELAGKLEGHASKAPHGYSVWWQGKMNIPDSGRLAPAAPEQAETPTPPRKERTGNLRAAARLERLVVHRKAEDLKDL